jgi:hypothetical protein
MIFIIYWSKYLPGGDIIYKFEQIFIAEYINTINKFQGNRFKSTE